MISPVRDGSGRLPLKAPGLAMGLWVFSQSAVFAFGDGHEHFGRERWGEYGLGPHLNYRGHGLNDFGYPYFTHWIGHGIGYEPPGYPYAASGTIDTGYPVYRDFGAFTGGPADPERFATAVHSAATTGSATASGAAAGGLMGPTLPRQPRSRTVDYKSPPGSGGPSGQNRQGAASEPRTKKFGRNL